MIKVSFVCIVLGILIREEKIQMAELIRNSHWNEDFTLFGSILMRDRVPRCHHEDMQIKTGNPAVFTFLSDNNTL